MNTSAQPDDPNDGKKSADPAPSRRDFYAPTVLAALVMAGYGWLAWYTWWNGGYGATTVVLSAVAFVAGVGGSGLMIVQAWRGRPVANALAVLLMSLLISTISFPGIVGSRLVDNDYKAVKSLRMLATAQKRFRENTATYAYPFSDLHNLTSPSGEPLIPSALTEADRPDKAYFGYYFMHGKTRSASPDTFEIFATPAQHDKSFGRTFFVDQDGRVLSMELDRSLTSEEALTMDTSDWCEE